MACALDKSHGAALTLFCCVFYHDEGIVMDKVRGITLSRVSTPLHTLRALEKKETLILRGGIAASPSGPLAPPPLVSSERRHSNLSTLLYTVSSSAQHFPPVAPAPLGRPRPPGADQIRSQFIQGQRAPVVLLSRPSTRPERGNYDPP